MNEQELELELVILAGLLHDIGKFEQRTGLKPGQNHSQLSGRFVAEIFQGQWQGLVELVENHHITDATSAPNPHLTRLITLADWLASGERRDPEEQRERSPEEMSLINIFSTLFGNYNYTYFPLQILPEDGNVQPQNNSKVNSQTYLELWQNFYQEAKSLTGLVNPVLVNRLLALLEKYTLFIPAAVYKTISDVSLYHHLKLTAAISACLYIDQFNYADIEELLNVFRNNLDEEERAVAYLIGGDISGIQNFIYNLRAEGALKGLRGRSLYLQLIAEAVAGKILKRFNLTRANQIYCGGGHFYLLVPATPSFTADIKEIISSTEQVLLVEHKGKLGITIAWQPVKALDFKREKFGLVWEKLHQELAIKKRRKFATALTGADYKQILGPTGIGGEMPACLICGEELNNQEQTNRICQMCEGFAGLGRRLHDANYLIEKPITQPDGNDAGWNKILKQLGIDYEFSKQQQFTSGELVYCINSVALETGVAGFRFIGKYVPNKDGETVELKDLADEASGIKRWGVLRADVDHLGEVFKKGLGEDNRSISRLSMLSYLISYFFSARIQALAQSIDFKNSIYLAYAGGDDLFVIGAWSKLPEFAHQIYKDFRQFTSNRLTLSAGIFIAPSEKFPVYQAAKLAGKAEASAKDAGRDSLSILGKELEWREYSDVKDIKNDLVNLLKSENFPRAILGILNAGWAEFQQAKEKEIPMFPVWRLIYALTRLKEREKDKPELLQALSEIESRIVQGVGLHPHLDLIVRWAELETR